MSYYIGMHSCFDDNKYSTDYFNNITGIEFCNFTSQESIDWVVEKSIKDGFEIGIHFPFNKNNYKYRDPLVLSKIESEREEAFLAIEKEVYFAAKSNAKYMLLHFPKPIVISREVCWSKVKLNNFEYIYDDEMTFEQFELLSKQAFKRLNNLSVETGIPIVLEIELMNEWLYDTNLLENLLDKYSNIKLCLDTARLHVVDKIDSKFSMKSFVDKVSKYTTNLHVANIQVDEEVKNGHYPAMPNLKEEDSWCNIELLLSHIKDKSTIDNVLFEHRSDIISRNQLRTCYNWIEEKLTVSP